MFFCLHLFAGEDLFDNTLLINNKSGADGTHRLLAVHVLLTLGTHCL